MNVLNSKAYVQLPITTPDIDILHSDSMSTNM